MTSLPSTPDAAPRVVRFSVQGVEIVGQPRVHHRTQVSKAGKIQHLKFIPRTRTGPGGRRVAPPIKQYREAVQAAALAVWEPRAPLAGPVELAVTWIFPRPKRLTWKRKPMPRVEYTGRFDLDNLYKGLADALEGILYRNDCQVWRATLTGWYASGDEQGHSTYVAITYQEE